MRQKIQDSNSNELAIQSIALMVRAQLLSLAIGLYDLPVQTRAQEALEGWLFPSRRWILVDDGLISEEHFMSIRYQWGCLAHTVVFTFLS